jgi:GT2 family glycosyltransferase
MQYNLTISVVLFKNRKEQILNLLGCIYKINLDYRLYLVDNSPTDKLKADLGDLLLDKRVEYIFNNKNIGFGAGHNIAFKKTLGQSKYHLVLNPDIYFTENVLESILEYMQENENVGVLMPKILNEDGSVQHLAKLLPTPFDFFLRRFLPFAFKKAQSNFELKHFNYSKVITVPFLSGCFLVFNMSALKKVGLFDEKIFMYTEDIDITRRILASSYKAIFYPYAQVYHLNEKKSFRNFKVFKTYLKSAIYYFNKWGWFFDKERKKINKKTLTQFQLK